MTNNVWAEENQASEGWLTLFVAPTTIALNNRLFHLEPGIFAWTK